MFLSRLAERAQDWRARRRLRRYGLRPATQRDLDFIMTEVIDGAKRGHFASSLLDPTQAQGFRDQLKNVIEFSAMVRGTERGVEQIQAKLWVYGTRNDDQVGYLLVAEKIPGSFSQELELYQVGVRKERRREGHGRRIVQLFVGFTPPSLRLYARCFHPSQTMLLLLQEIGFTQVNTMPFGTRELELSRE